MRRVFIALNCVVLAVASVMLIPAFALAAVPSSYTSFGYATGVHGIAGSDAFPNFQNGAVNNRYPMAEVQQDASPSSTAKGTYSDSGPATATVGSQYNQNCSQSGSQPPPPQICQNPNNQVPYATATYPGPSHGHIDQCNGCGSGPSADANAAQMNADASGYYAGGGTQPFSGASGKTNTAMDSGGTLTMTTHSEVDSFVIGTVKVSKVMVDINASSTLSGGDGQAHVTGGEVTANGQPVAVNDQGVTIQDKQPAPCSSAPKLPVVQQPPVPSPPVGLPPLPVGGNSGSSGGSGGVSRPGSSSGCVPVVNLTYITIFTVAPTKTVDGSHVTIWATGLHIKITQPSPGPGVPSQSAEYVLGEGFVDLQAGSSGGLDFSGFGGFGGFGGGDFGGFGDQSGAGGGSGSPASQLGAALTADRIPLAFLFLTLEALLLASAAAWVWARNAPSARVPEEVLSP
ncbi:MAG: hypothetical protein E6I53_08380 [Chloroflexi bacterium]|nr:MAG: hypothetical protein E6I53_08380 [Chloroflexota bacterium]